MQACHQRWIMARRTMCYSWYTPALGLEVDRPAIARRGRIVGSVPGRLAGTVCAISCRKFDDRRGAGRAPHSACSSSGCLAGNPASLASCSDARRDVPLNSRGDIDDIEMRPRGILRAAIGAAARETRILGCSSGCGKRRKAALPGLPAGSGPLERDLAQPGLPPRR